MNDRIQKVLDGELPVESLGEAERRELAAYRRAVDAALDTAALREPAPDVSAAVMWRVRGVQADPAAPPAPTVAVGVLARLRAVVAWLVAPQPVRLRPAAVLGAAALVAVALGALVGRPAGSGLAGEAEAPRLLVQFRLSAEAQEVALVGNFSGWEGHALEEVSPGVWTTTIPLEPGLYDYAFVIDGEHWKLDPLAPAVADGFGGANSRIAVLAPEGRGY